MPIQQFESDDVKLVRDMDARTESAVAGDDRHEAWNNLTAKERGQLRRDSEKMLAGSPELDDRATLEQAIHDAGSVRLSPRAGKGAQELVNDLPSDMELFDLREFGKGHENNTVIIRSKRKPPLTS